MGVEIAHVGQDLTSIHRTAKIRKCVGSCGKKKRKEKVLSELGNGRVVRERVGGSKEKI